MKEFFCRLMAGYHVATAEVLNGWARFKIARALWWRAKGKE
jgi:hypothetical protein